MRTKVKNKRLIYYREENKERREGRILFLLMMLLLTGILLSTSTYAWFTTNRVVTINTIDVKVQAAGGIEISADGYNWNAAIDVEDLTGAHSGLYPTSVNQLPDVIDPVSTGGNVSGGMLDMYLGDVQNDDDGYYILTSKKSVETESNGSTSEGKFVAFDVFLKTSESKELYITSESDITYSGDSSYGIENAVRVAFIIDGTLPSSSSLDSIQAMTTSDADNLYIWEPNYDIHTNYGVENASKVYGITTSLTGGAKLSYDGVISEIPKSANISLGDALASKYSTYFKTVDVDIATVSGFTNYTSAFTVGAGITKVRIYLWVEGQDVDCENNASYGDISFKLQLTTNPS